MRRRLVLPLVFLVAAACGGGGAGGGGGGGTGNTVPDALTPEEQAARAVEILTGCTLDQLTTMTQIAQILQDAAAGGGTGPVLGLGTTGFQYTPGLVIPYTLDLDADETVDATGFLALLDEQRQPTNPFDLPTLLALLAGGADALPDLLAQLPDDTFVSVSYVGTNLLVANGQILVRYVAGAPAGVEGTFTLPGGTCTSVFSWEEVGIESLQGEYPSVPFDVTITAGTDVLAGTITTDGTGVATASLTLNDGVLIDYEIDLAAGTVTPN